MRVFAFVTSGTGGDFPQIVSEIEAGTEAAIARLKRPRACGPAMVGRVSCLTARGAPTNTLFHQQSPSFGLSGVNRGEGQTGRGSPSCSGGSFAFAFHSAAAMLNLPQTRPCAFMIDGADDEIATIGTAAIANGPVFFSAAA